MLTAYLYHRGDRTLTQLDAEGVRQSQPASSADNGEAAHPFSGHASNAVAPQNVLHHDDADDDDETLYVRDEDAQNDDASQGEHTQGEHTQGEHTQGEYALDAEHAPTTQLTPVRVETPHPHLNGNGSTGGLTGAGAVPLRPKQGAKKNGVKGAFRGTTSRCREGELLWVDISEPTEEDYQLLIERFSLHPMVIEDLKAREGRPKLHDYGEYLYIIFHALSREREDGDEKTQDDEWLLSHTQTNGPRVVLKIQEIDCLVGSDYAITLHPERVKPFEDLKKRWIANPDLMRAGSSLLLYELMDEVLDEYFPLLDDFDEDVNQLEEQLFDVEGSSQGQSQNQQRRTSSDIFAFKRALVQVRRIAGPTRDIANVLLRRDAEAGGKHFAYYQDLYDHSTRIVDMVDTFRDILSGLHDSYLAMASNRMNEVMKTLTSASIMLLVPGLIAGIYGMNFENMPELHTHNGYFVTLGIMSVIVVTLFAIFKKKRWL